MYCQLALKPPSFGDREGTANCVTKILPNVRVNFLVRFASKPWFYWVTTSNPLELFRKFFGAVRAIFLICESFLAPDLQFRRARTGHKKPPKAGNTKKIRKNYKIPHPGLGPENTKKLPKKCKNGPRMTILYFFGNFSYFRGPTQGGGFCNFFFFFFVFPALGGFLCPVRARRNCNS